MNIILERKKLVLKFLAEKLSRIKAQVYILLLITIVSILSIFYVVTQNTIKEYQVETSQEFNLVENYVYSSISNAEQVVNGLAFLVSKTSIKSNNYDIFELIRNFDPQPKNFKAIPFSSLVVLNKNDLSIASSSSHITSFRQKDFSEAKCLHKTKENPLKLQIGQITIGLYSKEEIIPLGISLFTDQEFIGSICAGLSVSDLKNQVNNSSLYNNFTDINLLNISDQHIDASEVISFFKFTNIIKYFISDQAPKVYKTLPNYPYIIVASINTNLLYDKLKTRILVCFNYSLLFCCFAFLLFIIIKKFYTNPFQLIKKLLLKLPDKIFSNALDNKLHTEIINYKNTSPKQIHDSIVYLTRHMQALYEKEEKQELEHYAHELRKKILHLALIEHHYSPVTKVSKPKYAELYHNILITFVNEEYRNMSLYAYFKEITNYYIEYYHQMKIIVNLDNQQNKIFSFKYTALTETIFHILSFIERVAYSVNEDETVTITPYFQEQNKFPTIKLELDFSYSSQTSLGWEVGALFPYMSLFSIYLLAKENSLALNIEQNDSKIIFLLKPIDPNCIDC